MTPVDRDSKVPAWDGKAEGQEFCSMSLTTATFPGSETAARDRTPGKLEVLQCFTEITDRGYLVCLIFMNDVKREANRPTNSSIPAHTSRDERRQVSNK